MEVIVDLASFKQSPICACDLPYSCIDIITASVSDECLRLEVLGMEGMITIRPVMVEKCKGEVSQNFFVRLV